MGFLEEVAGKPVHVLSVGDPVAFPTDLVLFMNSTCYACGGGTNFQRVYRDSTGDLVADQIQPPLNGERSYIHGLSLDPQSYDAYAIVCDGYCGGIGEIVDGSTAELWRSQDGGITWGPIQSFEVDSYLGLYGVSGGRALIGRAIFDSEGDASHSFSWFPGDEPESPPAGMEGAFPWTVPGYGLAWALRVNATEPLKVRAFTGSGTDFVRPGDERLEWRYEAVTPDGWAIWIGLPPRSPTRFSYVAFATPAGEADRVYAWPGYDFRLRDGLDNRVFIGNALTTDDSGAAALLPHGPMAFEPVIVDFDSETVRVISDLPPAENSIVGGYTFPAFVKAGTFARVEAGDDCLNVREEPSTASTVLGCVASGVLLSVRLGEAPEDGWTPVDGPGGISGWAASEFLSRAAGGSE